MIRAGKALAALIAATALTCALGLSTASAATAPAWSIRSWAAPTNFAPGDSAHEYFYEVALSDAGGGVTDGSPIVLTDTLPAGLGVKSVELFIRALEGEFAKYVDHGPSACTTETTGEVSTVHCTITNTLPASVEPAVLHPSEAIRMVVHVEVPPSASGALHNLAEVEGGGAPPASVVTDNEASAETAPSGLSEFHANLIGEDGQRQEGAASHPYQYTTTFAAHTQTSPPGSGFPVIPARGDVKDVEVTLPPGLIGNPTAAERCSAQQFAETNLFIFEGDNLFQNSCPDGSAIGLVVFNQLQGQGKTQSVPLYNLIPPEGMPAQFGFQVVGVPIYINTKVRTGSDYGITAYLPNTTQSEVISAASVTIWGTPADPSHDRIRGHCLNEQARLSIANCPANLEAQRPFFRLPTSCASGMQTTMAFSTWPNPDSFASLTDSSPAPVGCSEPPFTPTISAKPTTNVADSPSGLHFDLHLPQAANEDPQGLGEADLRDATVTLPPGLSVNPSSAQGLGSCSEAQIGYLGEEGGTKRFTPDLASCPDSAKIGTVEVDTPLLDHPLPGAVYLAAQGANPFNSLLAIYITIEDPISGVVVKLPAEVKPDPNTGQLNTTVTQNPQLPFEDFKLDFFEGARAPLRTPASCGAYATSSSLVPWSSPEGQGAAPSDSFAIEGSPAGCGSLPNSPSFEAGTEDPLAAAYSPFLLRLKREDGSAELSGLNVSLPQGLTAKLAGVAECPEAQIAQARSRQAPGKGALEQASPSCPPSSLLGTVTVGAGPGPAPTYVQGKAYLTGPYKGAPLSLAIITPATAGPFDLGAVVVRAALQVDPETAKVKVISDPLPQILQGIPLDIRSIAVRIDRSQFTLNPTSCEPSQIAAQAISSQAGATNLQSRFQVGGCQSLGFKPKLSLKLKGQTKRGGHPALKATLTYPKGGAYSNIAFAQVALPHAEFLDQGNIATVCTRVQFAAHQCPKRSVYGFARAITPLFDHPLEGPVYLRSSSHQLPDLVADLNGQVEVVLDGRTDSVNQGLRNTFEAVPDAPVSKFTLELAGGKKKGLLENSTDLCKAPQKAKALFRAHSGRAITLRPELGVDCGGKGRKGKKAKRGS